MNLFTVTLGDNIPATEPAILETIDGATDFQVTKDPNAGLMFFIGHEELTENGARTLRRELDKILTELEADR